MDINLIIKESIGIKEKILQDTAISNTMNSIIDIAVVCFKQNRKILFCGNGGSAADAQHLAAELSGRYLADRPPLNAEALHVNTSYITAVANDYSFDKVYSRLVEGQGKSGDILFAISTSGNSPNIINAIITAKEKKMKIIGFTGESGGKMNSLCDFIIRVPSVNTPRIQEIHILLGHIFCQGVESNLFPI